MDGTIINTIKKVVELYGLDYCNHPNYVKHHWTEIDSWGFNELELASKDVIDDYFSDERFFQNLEYMDNAYEVLNRLKDKFKIYIVSMGCKRNLELKHKWLQKNLPFVEFIGCDFSEVNDKRHISMTDGVLIDDVADNLYTSNADVKILFGDVYPWNSSWSELRCFNWYEVEKFLMKISNL